MAKLPRDARPPWLETMATTVARVELRQQAANLGVDDRIVLLHHFRLLPVCALQTVERRVDQNRQAPGLRHQELPQQAEALPRHVRRVQQQQRGIAASRLAQVELEPVGP